MRPVAAAPADPGALTVAGGGLRIACGAGALDVLELQPAGKRRMAAGEFLHGLRATPAHAS